MTTAMTEPDSMAAALAALQGQLPSVVKGDTADTGKFRYSYATLPDITEQIMPVLSKLGLSFTCWPTLSDGRFVLRYELRHSSDSDLLTGEYPLGALTTPQAQGSAITYARRYALMAVTGIAPDDDDGQAAEADATRLIEEARALRRRPPETDEHGAATQAEITRMSTGPEPGATRLRQTAADDPWYADPRPLADVPNPEDQHGTATADQIRSIQARFGERGIKDRDVKLGTIGDIIGVRVQSSKDLSYSQAALVLEKL
jgi:hypothetical protein